MVTLVECACCEPAAPGAVHLVEFIEPGPDGLAEVPAVALEVVGG